MKYRDFKKCFSFIQQYMKESNDANKALQKLAKSSFVVCDIGANLLDAYIKLLSKNVGDEAEWISWYVFENDMGRRKLEVSFRGESRAVCSLRDLYWVIKG